MGGGYSKEQLEEQKKQKLLSLQKVWKDDLLNSVAPFWEKYGVDEEFGGYLTSIIAHLQVWRRADADLEHAQPRARHRAGNRLAHRALVARIVLRVEDADDEPAVRDGARAANQLVARERRRRERPDGREQ